MKNNPEIIPQIQFLKQIEDLISDSSTLVNELADLLKISIDSAYRRLRGETSLSFDEISTLCNTYNLSFDSFTGSVINSVTFRYAQNGSSKQEFIIYLQKIIKDIQNIANVPGAEILYAAEDIPIFHHYKHSEIGAFKIFYWMKSIMNIPELKNTRFSNDTIDNEIIDLCSKLYDNYNKISSTEIWTELTINSMLKQIQFYWESGQFESVQTAIDICDSLINELIDLQTQAEKSTKFSNEAELANNSGNYNLYLSEVEIGNNCILVKMNDIKTVYITHFTFNLISTNNSSFCDETEKWFDNLIKKSVLISGVSEKQRFQFFSKAIQSVEKLKVKITLE